MVDEPTIDREVVQPIVDRIDRLGGDGESLLAESGLIDLWYDRSLSTLPEARVWELFERAAKATDLPGIGLQAGADFRVRDLGMFGRQLQQGLTCYRLLEEYCHSVNRYSSHARFWLRRAGRGVWFCRRGIDLIDVGRDYVEQFTVQLMIRLVQLSAGSDWVPTRIRLQTRTSRSFREDDSFDASELDGSRPVTGIWVPDELMLKVVRSAGAPLTRLARTHVTLGSSELPNLQDIAAQLGYSKRTLQRRLDQDGLDWSRLLDQVRLRESIKMLATTDTRLAEIAERLRYTDAANFGRAFRRWTGVTPRTYRLYLWSGAFPPTHRVSHR